jgi:hypothetical protein
MLEVIGEVNLTVAEDMSACGILQRVFAAPILCDRDRSARSSGADGDAVSKDLEGDPWCLCGEVPMVGVGNEPGFASIAAFMG